MASNEKSGCDETSLEGFQQEKDILTHVFKRSFGLKDGLESGL